MGCGHRIAAANQTGYLRARLESKRERGLCQGATMSTTEISRREFVGAALAATAFSSTRVMGANDRISIGIIGCGDRGRESHIKDILGFRQQANVEITAVCDPWKQMREQAAAQ